MEDMYDSMGAEGEAPASPDAAQKTQEDAKEEGSPIVFNKEACPDAKPGDMLMVKVVRVHEAEIEGMVSKDDEEKEPEQASEPQGGDAPMAPEGGGNPMYD